MWLQTAATPYLLQPWNSAPLTGSPPEAIAVKPRARKTFALVLPRICVPGLRSAQPLFLISISPLPSVYPPHFYYRKRKHTFLITSLCIRSFPSFCRMGVLFAQNKRIFSHTSYPERAFSELPCRLSAQSFPPNTGTKPRTHTNYGSRQERRFWGA